LAGWIAVAPRLVAEKDEVVMVMMMMIAVEVVAAV
jgi:hypothetical protein